MRKSVILLVVLIVLGGIVYTLTRPEPTPAERLSEAAQDAGDAARDAVEELAANAEETVDALQEETEAKAEELQNEAAVSMEALSAELQASSQEAQIELEKLVQGWRDTGIVTDDGVDFDAALTAVEQADMTADTKAEVSKILAFIRDLPGDAAAKLEALEASL